MYTGLMLLDTKGDIYIFSYFYIFWCHINKVISVLMDEYMNIRLSFPLTSAMAVKQCNCPQSDIIGIEVI
jgi:hypothetical protein